MFKIFVREAKLEERSEADFTLELTPPEKLQDD